MNREEPDVLVVWSFQNQNWHMVTTGIAVKTTLMRWCRVPKITIHPVHAFIAAAIVVALLSC